MFKLNIKEARLKAGLTQEQLANEVGVSQGYISKLEKDGFNRESSPSLLTIESFGKALRCCPSTLITYHCSLCSIGVKLKDRRDCDVNTRNYLIKQLQTIPYADKVD